ncbi:uncharacterized protein LOC108194823 [Daucus carota subsp. sativus]|uniref:uncharacterized protein LOC108194823 n=1 Tax=Daucus carota subsp. sativus TaxID=79200 RepID=UPI0030831F13
MIGIIDTVDDGIDWDITLDNSQIDWDIGTVEEADDSSNGLASYEIINASDIKHSYSQNDAEMTDQASLKNYLHLLKNYLHLRIMLRMRLRREASFWRQSTVVRSLMMYLRLRRFFIKD